MLVKRLSTPLEGIVAKLKASPALREALVFIGLSALFYLVWQIGYELILYPDHRFDLWVNRQVAKQAVAIFQLLGRDCKVVPYGMYKNLIVLDTHAGANVDTPCNGVPMLYMFVAFIVAHPGPLKSKAWFIPFGLAVIHALNLVRIMALAVIAVYYREYFYINHKYVYTILVYSLIISLFAWWHLRLANPAKK
jgi:exosortase family protein XrtF